MKRKGKHILKKLHQIAAYLMVLLFLSMPMLQLLHSHGQTNEIASSIDGKPVIEKLTEQCKLCDFLAHKQFKEYQISNPIELVIPIVQPVKTRTNLIAGNYTFTLNGFTNKGPPTIPSC